jgi:translation initiation factor IF-3
MFLNREAAKVAKILSFGRFDYTRLSARSAQRGKQKAPRKVGAQNQASTESEA